MDEYQKGGFGQHDIGYGKKPAILVIDFMKAHTLPEFPFGAKPLALRALNNTVAVLEVARKKGVPVAVCYNAFQGPHDVPYTRMQMVKEGMFVGNPSVDLDERVVDRSYDLIVRKTGPSMFYETKVDPFLNKANVDTIIITGVNTSGCVRATVIDSYQRNYRTIVPEDCVGDLEDQPHIDNLRDIGRRYADIVDRNSVISYLNSL